MTKDVLDDLFTNEEQTVSNEVLRDILVDIVQLTSDGAIFFLQKFNELKNEEKILVVLLAKKVLKLKKNMDELTSPKEVQEITGLPKGSVNPLLRELARRRFVTSKDGRYYVPSYAVHTIKALLGKTRKR